jgi:hypothetical protein
MEGKIKCIDCAEEKELSEFFHPKWKFKSDRCIVCHYTGPNSKTLYLKKLLSIAKLRSKRKNLPFDITEEDLFNVATEYCPITNKKLHYIHRKFNKDYANCASLDRIDSSKGYTKDNIRIISLRANVLKSCCSFEDLLNMQNYFIKYSPLETQNKYKQLVNLNLVLLHSSENVI